jgi:E3 ubiquitin-protein ligase RNF115/126
MAEEAQRFFCHECSVEIPRVAADFTCPDCNSGFIEELPDDEPPRGSPHDNLLGPAEDHDPDDLVNLLLSVGQHGRGPGGHILGGRRQGGRVRPRLRHHIRIAARPPAGPIGAGGARPPGGPPPGMDQAALENALQDFLGSLAGINMGGTGGGPQFHFIGPGGGGLLGPAGGFHLHGNPGDYAWGQGGLDAIITQMLNHMDGAGPPPMAKENIQTIPTIKITPEQMEKSQSCSVCWEDFTVGEEVKLLECEHCFHAPCIIPWLELHGTCPVCRKELKGGAVGSRGQEVEQRTEEMEGEQAPPESNSPPSTNSGGLTGLIQSALNQVFSSSWSSSPSSGSSGTSSDSRPVLTSSSTSSDTSTVPSSSSPAAGASSSSLATHNSGSSSEDETPAARRQRLDSEFVDLDFD